MRIELDMKAMLYYEYGPPDVLRLEDIETPAPVANEVLVRVRAASINGSDREGLLGKPLYARMPALRRPHNKILGSDVSGEVVSIGSNVTAFAPGDPVFGEVPGYRGAFAEFSCVPERNLLRKPAGLTFEQAAAIPQAGAIALRAIRGRVNPGDAVLINGAGGSAGSFAVQFARLHKAIVTAVDGPGKEEYLRSIGASEVIDYTNQDFTDSGKEYDLILDLIAHRSVFALRRALRNKGLYLFVGGSISTALQILLLGPWVRISSGRNVRFLVVPQNRENVRAMCELCEAGEIIPVIDRCYPLERLPEAMRYVMEGHAKGKVVITIATPPREWP